MHSVFRNFMHLVPVFVFTPVLLNVISELFPYVIVSKLLNLRKLSSSPELWNYIDLILELLLLTKFFTLFSQISISTF